MKNNVLTKGLFAALLLASTVVVAEEYPAADYQPTVVYSEGASSSASSSEKSEAKAADESPAPAAEAKSESSSGMLLGLVALAVAGGFFLSRGKGSEQSSTESYSAPTYAGEPNGLTGVEKYLQAHSTSAATGVEKYLAKKEAADREAALTGVDKYLRNRG